MGGGRRPRDQHRPGRVGRAARTDAGAGRIQFGVAVELASGAIQDHFLYAKPPLFGSKLWVDLVVDGQALVTKDIPIKSHDAYAPIIGVVAEHPEGFMRDVNAAVAPSQGFEGQPTTVLTHRSGRPSLSRRGMVRHRPADLAGRRHDAAEQPCNWTR